MIETDAEGFATPMIAHVEVLGLIVTLVVGEVLPKEVLVRLVGKTDVNNVCTGARLDARCAQPVASSPSGPSTLAVGCPCFHVAPVSSSMRMGRSRASFCAAALMVSHAAFVPGSV